MVGVPISLFFFWLACAFLRWYGCKNARVYVINSYACCRWIVNINHFQRHHLSWYEHFAHSFFDSVRFSANRVTSSTEWECVQKFSHWNYGLRCEIQSDILFYTIIIPTNKICEYGLAYVNCECMQEICLYNIFVCVCNMRTRSSYGVWIFCLACKDISTMSLLMFYRRYRYLRLIHVQQRHPNPVL